MLNFLSRLRGTLTGSFSQADRDRDLEKYPPLYTRTLLLPVPAQPVEEPHPDEQGILIATALTASYQNSPDGEAGYRIHTRRYIYDPELRRTTRLKHYSVRSPEALDPETARKKLLEWQNDMQENQCAHEVNNPLLGKPIVHSSSNKGQHTRPQIIIQPVAIA